MTNKVIDDGSSHLNDLLQNRPDVFYQEEVFRGACLDFGCGVDPDFFTDRINEHAPLSSMLRVLPSKMREHFSKLYTRRFDQMNVVRS